MQVDVPFGVGVLVAVPVGPVVGDSTQRCIGPHMPEQHSVPWPWPQS